jgi:hypothetical protein
MQVTKTTTHLKRARARWYDLPIPVTIAICVLSLISIAALVGKIRSVPAVAAMPTPPLPILIIATAPAQIPPTAAPAAQVAAALPRFVVCYDQPVNGAVLGPIPAPDASAIVARYGAAWVMTPWNGGYCWLRAADIGVPDVADLAPTDAPQVVYQVVNQPAPLSATPTEPYLATNDGQPAGDFYTTPPHVDPAAQQALVGSDPNALACGGSPLCGGLTNAQAQAALDAQRAGR